MMLDVGRFFSRGDSDMFSRKLFFCSLTFLAAALTGSAALAGPFLPQGPFVRPVPRDRLPLPTQVPGKEYSNNVDRKAHPNQATPDVLGGQVVYWDGAGGTTDTTDFFPGNGGIPERSYQIDALANRSDVLFDEVIGDDAFLLFSTDQDNRIFYETPITGGGGVWAQALQIDQIPPDDVDALEVWGPSNPSAELEERVNQGLGQLVIDPTPDDANRYSTERFMDPFEAAVFDSLGNPIFSHADIAAAIGRPDLADSLDFDLDAMMMSSLNILFSIDPIDIFDGGEIWAWDGITPGGATYLVHGGHVWDTAFDVMGTFGTATENINALEAAVAPEPTILALMGIGLAGLGFRRRKLAA